MYNESYVPTAKVWMGLKSKSRYSVYTHVFFFRLFYSVNIMCCQKRERSGVTSAAENKYLSKLQQFLREKQWLLGLKHLYLKYDYTYYECRCKWAKVILFQNKKNLPKCKEILIQEMARSTLLIPVLCCKRKHHLITLFLKLGSFLSGREFSLSLDSVAFFF